MTSLHKAALGLLAAVIAGLVLLWWRLAAVSPDAVLHDSYYVVAQIRQLAVLAGPAILNLLLLLVLPFARDGRGGWLVWTGALIHALAVFILGWVMGDNALAVRRYDEYAANEAAFHRLNVILYAAMLTGLVMQLVGWVWLILTRLRR